MYVLKSEISLFISFLSFYRLIFEFFFHWIHALSKPYSMKILGGVSFCCLIYYFFSSGFLVFACCFSLALSPIVWFYCCHAYSFVLLTYRELHPFSLFVLIECGWLLDSFPVVFEISLFFSLFHWEDQGSCGVVAPEGKLSGQSVGGWNVWALLFLLQFWRCVRI